MNKPALRGAAAWAAAVAAYATARAAELTHYADAVAPTCETDDMPARAAAEAGYDKLVDETAAALAKAYETPAADFGGVLWKLARLAEDETGDQTRERVAAISADVRRLSARKPMAVGAITYSPILKTTAVCMAESYRKGDLSIEQLIFHLADIHNHAATSGETEQETA